jgi:phage FluMu protein Com
MPLASTRNEMQGKPILCQKCGQGGGTLKKVSDGYIHVKCPPRTISNTERKSLNKMRWPVSKAEFDRLRRKGENEAH